MEKDGSAPKHLRTPPIKPLPATRRCLLPQRWWQLLYINVGAQPKKDRLRTFCHLAGVKIGLGIHELIHCLYLSCNRTEWGLEEQAFPERNGRDHLRTLLLVDAGTRALTLRINTNLRHFQTVGAGESVGWSEICARRRNKRFLALYNYCDS